MLFVSHDVPSINEWTTHRPRKKTTIRNLDLLQLRRLSEKAGFHARGMELHASLRSKIPIVYHLILLIVVGMERDHWIQLQLPKSLSYAPDSRLAAVPGCTA